MENNIQFTYLKSNEKDKPYIAKVLIQNLYIMLDEF